MHVISRDSPCYLLTTVAKNRLLVFRTDELQDIACKALDDARKSGKFSLYAYVIMPDHFHLISDSARSSADTLRFINGIMSHNVIAHLKEKGYESSFRNCDRKPSHGNTAIHSRIIIPMYDSC
jgi:REP element-mobilizing transposase RayT